MRIIFRVFVIILLLPFYGCEEHMIDVDRFGSVSGIVVDGDTYEPLSGVMITTNPASSAVLTDEGGVFLIDKIKSGDVLINARKNEFLTGSINVAVYEAADTPLTFFLLKDEKNVGDITLYDPVPGNGASNQPLSQNLSWKVSTANSGAELLYSVFLFESGSTTQKLVGENLTLNEANVSGLKANTTYFWYVVAKYDGRNVANSPTWSFRTGSGS